MEGKTPPLPPKKVDWPTAIIHMQAWLIVYTVKNCLESRFNACKSTMQQLAAELYSLSNGTIPDRYSQLGAEIGKQACQLLQNHQELLHKYATPEQLEERASEVASRLSEMMQAKRSEASLPSTA